MGEQPAFRFRYHDEGDTGLSKTEGVVMKRTYSQGWADIFGKDLPKKAKAERTGKPAEKPKPKSSEPEAEIDASTGSALAAMQTASYN